VPGRGAITNAVAATAAAAGRAARHRQDSAPIGPGGTLLIALEALPGDKVPGLRTHGLAFRQMMLSHTSGPGGKQR
jgi:hypothetical protein